jgi:hypothetical protein
MQNSIDDFQRAINRTIRDKFTSLQPSVQWKFNEAAWKYLYRSKKGEKPGDIQKIEFRQVYPLYGAVDMRNSTIERNKALINDLSYQFNHLQEVLNALKEKSGFGLTDEFIFKCNKWLKVLRGVVTPNDEIRLNQFLNEEAHPSWSISGRRIPRCRPSLTNISGILSRPKAAPGKTAATWKNRCN